MDYEKIGKFIKELRIENNMTQQQLADKIPITREAVSKWERGRNKPDRTSLEILSNLFNVTTEELILGRRNEFNNIKENKELALNLYEENNKKQKVVKYLIISIIGLIILFFAYYFISTFNSIKIYYVTYSDNDAVLKNGIFVTTREKFYFNFSDIRIPDDITKLELYYMDNDNKHTIYETNNSYINIYDYYQYERYFDYKDLNIVINNLYLLIKSDTNEYNIKLNVKKDFANNKLFFFNEDNVINNQAHLLEYDTNIDIDLIKEKFELIDDTYIFEDACNKILFYYLPQMNLINLRKIESKENYEEWNFYIKENNIAYKNVKDNIILNNFSFKDNKYTCIINNCTFDEEKIKYFFTKLNDILGKN